MRFILPLTFLCSTVSAYTWKNVKIGGGGGFVPGIVFNPTKQGLAYARTDIGGLYRLNSDDSWTPLTDFADSTNWHDWGVNSVATDPVDPTRVYIAVGMYTNSWDPNVGSILRSSDYGATWAETKLTFKIGGNQPGRGIGERLAIDPNNNKIIYFGAPSGNGLYKSTDQGVTFSKVSSFSTVGDYAEDPTDTYGYSSDPIGVTSVVFDTTSALVGGATSRIFVSVGTLTTSSLWISNDAGATWTAPAGQPSAYFPHRMKFSKAESALYISYGNTAGPYDAGNGTVYRYATNGTFKNITPAWQATNSLTFGYGGLAIDALVPGTLVVAADNLWWPDVQIFRSNDSGTTWTQIWDWNDNHYTYSTAKAPWIDASRASDDTKKLGWMVESLEIDPFDSNHWLYGTGLTVYGGHNLKSWPAVLVESLADGIEETSVQDLICPPGGAPLLSGVGDDSGFRHTSLDTSPAVAFISPLFATTPSLDYAGTKPLQIVRVGNDGSAGTSQMALSSDGGANWYAQTLTSTSAYGGKIAYSADAATIVWRTASLGTYLFKNGAQTTVSTLPTSALLKSDKVNANYFYGVDQNGFYVSSDGGATFATASTVSGTPSDLKVHPSVAGDVWYSSSSGLFHSTDFGKTFTATTTSVVGSFALGKGANTYPNVYGFVTVSGNPVFSLSTDVGVTFTSIQSAGIGFGAASANVVAASQDTAGLVFVGTNGRGIFYGLGSGSSVTTTKGTTTTSKSSTSTSKAATTTSTSKSTTASTTSKTTLTTSTIKTTSTTKTSTSTAATSTGVAPKYGQCGGIGWTGPTTCVAGSTCTYSNDWYSQCV